VPEPARRRRPLVWTLALVRDDRPPARVLRVTGRLGAPTSAALGAALTDAMTGPPARVVLDCAGVDYLSSAGLAVLDEAAARARAAGGQLVLCHLHEAVRMSLELAGLATRFTVVDTVEQAVADARG
jgi:anti-anti-sigma factor